MEFIQIKELSQNDGDNILEMIREIGPGENGFGNVDYDMEDSEFGNYIKKKYKYV